MAAEQRDLRHAHGCRRAGIEPHGPERAETADARREAAGGEKRTRAATRRSARPSRSRAHRGTPRRWSCAARVPVLAGAGAIGEAEVGDGAERAGRLHERRRAFGQVDRGDERRARRTESCGEAGEREGAGLGAAERERRVGRLRADRQAGRRTEPGARPAPPPAQLIGGAIESQATTSEPCSPSAAASGLAVCAERDVRRPTLSSTVPSCASRNASTSVSVTVTRSSHVTSHTRLTGSNAARGSASCVSDVPTPIVRTSGSTTTGHCAAARNASGTRKTIWPRAHSMGRRCSAPGRIGHDRVAAGHAGARGVDEAEHPIGGVLRGEFGIARDGEPQLAGTQHARTRSSARRDRRRGPTPR